MNAQISESKNICKNPIRIDAVADMGNPISFMRINPKFTPIFFTF